MKQRGFLHRKDVQVCDCEKEEFKKSVQKCEKEEFKKMVSACYDE